MAKGKLENPKELFITKDLTHDYSVNGNQSITWNASSDSGFSVQGYTAIGIVSFQTNAAEVFVINLGLGNSYGIFLRNISTAAKSAQFAYTVLYKKD